MAIDPVEVAFVTDTEAVRRAIKTVIERGNPVVPTPARNAYPKPVVLKYAKVRSWSAFEKTALNWTIVVKDGIYQIKPGRRRPDRGWEDDPEKIEIMPPGAALETVIERATALVQTAFKVRKASLP